MFRSVLSTLHILSHLIFTEEGGGEEEEEEEFHGYNYP